MEMYGVNYRPPPRRIGFFEFAWEAFKDVTLRVLLFFGVVSLFIGIFADDHPEIGWIEGFAIIAAVFIVILVTAINDYNKQKKFISLYEANQSTHEVAIIRNSEKQFVHPSVLLVGDILVLESGVHIPADCLLLSGEDC
jgi:magnesium-transporting ATPase (P-type)